jgi:hypothetical protein
MRAIGRSDSEHIFPTRYTERLAARLEAVTRPVAMYPAPITFALLLPNDE